MKRLKVMGSVLLVLVMSIGLLSNAIALTSTEKENKYNTALEELESYLESPEDERDAVVQLNAIMADFDELGNYLLSRELYCYAFILLKIEECDFEEWHIAMYLEQLRKSERFTDYLKSNKGTALRSADALSAYVNGRKAEATGDYAAAIENYDGCLTFSDAMIRQTDLMENQYANAYNQASALMQRGAYEEAYVLYKTCRQYKDAEFCMSYIADLLGYDPSKCGKAHTWLEATYEAPKTCSVCGKTEGEPLHRTVAGDYIIFGAYEQDNNTANGKEPIEWLVLDVDEKTKRVLVISKYALDCKQYNTTYTDITWEKCSLRAWLNNEFISAAFSTEEQAAIPMALVSADENPDYSTAPGRITMDRVFALSIKQVNQFFVNDDARMCAPTDYAVANKVYTEDGNCWWWLRTPGETLYKAAGVSKSGYVYNGGDNVHFSDMAVRPAMWIDLDLLP